MCQLCLLVKIKSLLIFYTSLISETIIGHNIHDVIPIHVYWSATFFFSSFTIFHIFMYISYDIIKLLI